MITFDAALNAVDRPEISGINVTSLTQQDVVNLILQRSEIIRDQPNFNRYIKAWTKGDDAPLLGLINQMGMEALIRRAAAFIYLEYLELRPVFDAKPPRSVADIGCGYALFDLFLSKDHPCDLHLIDLEDNATRHFGFESQGAAYSSLKTAKKLLIDNGVPEQSITTLNPRTDDVDALRDLDFAVSFISCGFHYPWQTYQKFFENSVQDTGRILIDIRARTLPTAVQELSEIGYVRVLEQSANNSAYRMLIAKTLGV